MVAVLGTRVHNGDATFDLGHKIRTIVERSIRKWVLWISFYNIKFKSIWPAYYIFRYINAIGFLFLKQHTTPLLNVKIHFGVLHMRGTDVTRSDTP